MVPNKLTFTPSAAGPGGGRDLLAGRAQLHPQRLGGHRGAGAERIDLIPTDRPAESAGVVCDRLRDGVIRVRRDIVVRRSRARRDGDVTDGGVQLGRCSDVLRSAQTPLDLSMPRSVLALRVPLLRRALTTEGWAPSSEIKMTFGGAASAGR